MHLAEHGTEHILSGWSCDTGSLILGFLVLSLPLILNGRRKFLSE
jgi:hypothetical protein